MIALEIKKEDNKYIYVIVGKNIRRIRKEKGLTQVQLADLIGYNEGTIANIENDSFQTCSLEFLYVISKALDIPMAEFFKDIKKIKSKIHFTEPYSFFIQN